MSRESSDEFGPDGNVVNGFDYDLQVWVINGVVQRCGHPEAMDCDCTARRFAGMKIQEAKS